MRNVVVELPPPGEDVIGRRRIDTRSWSHGLGATFEAARDAFKFRVDGRSKVPTFFWMKPL